MPTPLQEFKIKVMRAWYDSNLARSILGDAERAHHMKVEEERILREPYPGEKISDVEYKGTERRKGLEK